ncbi:hypothetical protein PUN4_180123 [Paraburkholderia unamae]|uniref:methylenetetrahydrofolate reductase C-terminal domain-containing protein n=1 Tax=Paraburkholderia unamae TaxID=219649 RepID=UPI001CB3766F|nr:methylenetetrahydrofolate reductase C-terminal domain-containing protein [Paraburkholderia unamae]CAG9252216.1 hypothetical protein PUN4_180123 [Paraburkholderia unamae]
MSSLKQALDEGRFVCVLEVVPQQSPSRLAALEPIVQRGHLADWPLLPAFADRVGAHSDLNPLEGAVALGNPASSLLHFSGKDRARADLLHQMDSMKARGLEQLLLLSGDRLPGHHPDQTPVRYLESVASHALHAVERTAKRPLVGCDTCGSCRLQETLYVCPETCPKGLANGPCGGTRLNRCEFGDRECEHSVKYRIAKSADQLPVLAQTLIPAIDAENRHRSSWPEWFTSDTTPER